MEILKVSVKEIAGFTGHVHMKGNTIIMGGNSKGKTRLLKILYSASKNTLSKDFKDNTTVNSKLTIVYKVGMTKKVAKYSGVKLSPVPGAEIFSDDCVNPIFIEANTIDINAFITDSIQASISSLPEFNIFKSAVEAHVNGMLGRLNASTVFDGVRLSLSNSASEKMPKYKVELTNGVSEVKNEGDGFKKALTTAIVLEVGTNLVLIDEIENHMSVKTIIELLSTQLSGKLVIASSHRIEVDAGINSVTPINNEVIDKIGAYISSGATDDVIVVEGKNDLPILIRALELIGQDKTIVVATNRDQAIKISKKYGVRAYIDSDGISQTEPRVKTTSKLQMENYVPQDFIDSDPKLSGISMTDNLSISDMTSSAVGITDNGELKSYIADKAEDWLEDTNPLIVEIRDLLSM